ncbi:uncharacterized protein LOC144118490 [Amblyomma americanum]
METTLQQRARQYNQDINSIVPETFSSCHGGSADTLRELIRSIVREELQRFRLPQVAPALLPVLTEVVRDEAPPQFDARPTYASVVCRTADYGPTTLTPAMSSIGTRHATAPGYGITSMSPVSSTAPYYATAPATVEPRPRKSDLWRTPDCAPEPCSLWKARVPFAFASPLSCFHHRPPELLCWPSLAQSASGKLTPATSAGKAADVMTCQDPASQNHRADDTWTESGNDSTRYSASNLWVTIDGTEITALLDTGADYSVMSRAFDGDLKKVLTPWTGTHMRTAGGHIISPVGKCTARVGIHGFTYVG